MEISHASHVSLFFPPLGTVVQFSIYSDSASLFFLSFSFLACIAGRECVVAFGRCRIKAVERLESYCSGLESKKIEVRQRKPKKVSYISFSLFVVMGFS